jgi:hypothetical protein
MPAATTLEAVFTSPSRHSPAVNEDEIPLTLSSTSCRSRSIFKKKSQVHEDEKSLSSTLKKNRSSSSCRSSVKTVGLLSLSDDVSHHSISIEKVQSESSIKDKQLDENSLSSTLKKNRSNSSCRSSVKTAGLLSLSDSPHSASIKKVQSQRSVEGKKGEVTQSRSSASSPAAADVDAMFSTLSSATGKSKPERASRLSSPSISSESSLGRQPVLNMNAVLARSIEDAESIAGLLGSSLSGHTLSTKPKSTSLDDSDIGDSDINVRNARHDERDASDDDDSVPFNLTDFLADFDDLSVALSGPQLGHPPCITPPVTCSVSSGQDEGTEKKNNDSEEEKILFHFTKEVEKLLQQQQQQHHEGSVLSSFSCEELPSLPL